MKTYQEAGYLDKDEELDEIKIQALYFDEDDIYIQSEGGNLYLIARYEKLSKKKKREIVNDCVVPDEFYDDFSGTLEDAIEWLKKHRELMIENFDNWMLEYTGFEEDLGYAKIVGKYVGNGKISHYSRLKRWAQPQALSQAIKEMRIKKSNIKTVLDYYKQGE